MELKPFFLNAEKWLRLKKSVRTDPVCRIINRNRVKRCVAPTPNEHLSKTINGGGAMHLKDYLDCLSL